MAVKGLDIFKLSPKKNCKECGSPTCMAFCMKVAQGAVPITKCPYMSEEAIALLSEATAPPMQTITVGAHKLGGETVMMRHEKTLVNRNLFAATLDTSMDDASIEERIALVKKVDYERIGEREMVECVFVHDAGDCAKFVELCKKAAALPDRTVIIDTKDVETAKAAVEAIKDSKPILNGANKDNFAAMSEIAKAAGLVLGVSGKDLSELRASLDEIRGAAHGIIGSMEQKMAENRESEGLERVRALEHKPDAACRSLSERAAIARRASARDDHAPRLPDRSDR